MVLVVEPQASHELHLLTREGRKERLDRKYAVGDLGSGVEDTAHNFASTNGSTLVGCKADVEGGVDRFADVHPRRLSGYEADEARPGLVYCSVFRLAHSSIVLTVLMGAMVVGSKQQGTGRL